MIIMDNNYKIINNYEVLIQNKWHYLLENGVTLICSTKTASKMNLDNCINPPKHIMN